MPRLVGHNTFLGIFEKQILNPNDITDEFLLQIQAGSSMSLLVVQNGFLLEPLVDYTIKDGGRKIKFATIPPSTQDLYVVFMGRALDIPSVAGNLPVYQKFSADGIQTDFTITETSYPLYHPSTLIFVDGVQQKFGVDWDIIAPSTITFTVAPPNSKFVEVYIHGVERSDLVTVDPLSISTDKIATGAVTAEKLDLRPTPYTTSINTFGGMTNSGTIIHEAEYIDKGTITELSVHFTTTLGGTQDNKIRIELPIQMAQGTVNLAGSVNLSSDTQLENGIIRWGSVSAIDIYRQFGVNYTLEEWTAEIKLSYKTILS